MIVEEPEPAKAISEVQRDAMAALLESDPEGWSSLRGMMAMLALPLVHGRGIAVEVEIAPGTWRPIDQVSVTATTITAAVGMNGHRTEYPFPIAGGVPRWRCERWGSATPTHLADGAR